MAPWFVSTIREAMRGKGMVALGRVVLAKRERVIMLQPWDKGLMGTTLRYPYEVRDARDYFYDIPDVKIAPEVKAWICWKHGAGMALPAA